MKVFKVVYPFALDGTVESPNYETYYAGVKTASRDALYEFIDQEEYEDEGNSTEHLSKQPAKVYEVDVKLKRSVIAAILNDESPIPPTTETLVHEFRYRRGKIVVTNAKAVTEPENVG